MRTKVIFLLTTVIAALGFASCGDDNKPSFDFSGDVEIRSFVIDGANGVIDEQKGTINFLLPAGTDVSNLTPRIEIAEGATVSPASGEAVDFTVSRQYTVSNGDIYQVYTVSVETVKAQITKFTIDGISGKIDEYEMTILLYMGAGADITALTPVVEYTYGAEIDPAAGEPVDFTNPVKYTLSYEGSIFEYTVTVLDKDGPLVLYNGEDISPSWWDAGQAPDLDTQTANPKPNRVNSTARCAGFTFAKGSDPWSGGGLSNLSIDPAVYSRFSVMVLKEVAGPLRIEVQGSGADNQFLYAEYSADNLREWQEFIFELPEDHGFGVIHTLLVAPHCPDGNGDDPDFFTHKMYWDEVTALPKE